MTTPEDRKSARTPLIAGNWKMNLDHLEAVRLLDAFTTALPLEGPAAGEPDIVVFPPFTDLRDVQTLTVRETVPLSYGGQDLSEHDSGAYTGDISGAFLAKLGCTHVLVGHSERRTIHGEDDRLVAAKAQAAYRHGLLPVVCVGEGLEIRRAGTHVEHTLTQVRGALEGLGGEYAEQVVIAYEPVWAIGTGEVAGPEDAQEMCAAIRTEIEKILGPASAASTRILYGGSVKAANAAAILAGEDVDGVLVGGASLDAREFAAIAQAAMADGVGAASHTVS